MKFEELGIHGMYLIHAPPIRDERGYFVKTFNAESFVGNKLESAIKQINVSHCIKAGTLRGLHYQAYPNGEAKIVSVLRGSIADVVLDMRTYSPTFGKAVETVIKENEFVSLYVPEYCAHGYQALEDDTLYQFMSTGAYAPDSERIVRWDKVPGITWRITPPILSEKDSRGYK